MNEDALKLTAYFGERDRTGRRFVVDALTDIYARHALQTSVALRGAEGFGFNHPLQTDRLLTLSEDLPMVSVAVDTRARIEAALPDISALRFSGLVTLGRARMLSEPIDLIDLPAEPQESAKLTVYVGRRARVGSTPAHMAIVDLLHERGVAGATVLLGVDGTSHGERQRATFFGRNAEVPLMVIAIADGRRIAAVLPELGALLQRPIMTLERVRICKRDGEKLAEPHDLPGGDAAGLGVWQKLVVYAGEQSRHRGHPLPDQLVRSLLRAGAACATSLRGIWGYHGDHRPHGDSFWQMRRHVPALTVIVDTPERTRAWFAIVDELTDETGLVTSEMVPAYRATAPQVEHGGLRLARPGH